MPLIALADRRVFLSRDIKTGDNVCMRGIELANMTRGKKGHSLRALREVNKIAEGNFGMREKEIAEYL